MCACKDVRDHWPHRYRFDDLDGFGFGGSSGDHPLEHADEEAGQAPGFRTLVVRFRRFGYYHGADSVCEQVQWDDRFAM